MKVPDKMHVVVKILLKALANLPHTDFVLCKCLLSQVGCLAVLSGIAGDKLITFAYLISFCAGGVGRAAGEDAAVPGRLARDVPVQGVLAADPRPGKPSHLTQSK